MRTDRLRDQLAQTTDGEFKAVLDQGLTCWDPIGGPDGHDYPKTER
ncbi:hypothetical protein [Streptomyces yokosukanensis]|nr:hypothetical protein [Streptomyces yokosukanensis]